jgi:prevent-host-death family protein
MEKTIASFEARRQFGKVLRDVEVRGNSFVVERHGEPVAALVPLRIYEQWKREQDNFFALLDKAQQNANLSEEEAMELALEAVAAVRAERLAAE